jgi:hypothetical protein
MQDGQTCRRRGHSRLLVAAVLVAAGTAARAAIADDGPDTAPPTENIADASTPAPTPDSEVETSGIAGYFADWADRVARARATQPSWASPLVTTTGLLEQRVRFDASQSQSGNGTDTTTLDGGKGLDMIVSDSNEIRIALPPYNIRTGAPAMVPGGQPIQPLSGFGDWTVMRVEQRLASSPESDGDYILSAWLQVLAPTGIARLTSNTWAWSPVFAYGKGWGDFDIQGTLGTIVPATHAGTLGHPVQNNIALQYHLRPLFWPQIEANWTWFPDGQRGGLNQVFLTPGLVLGRIALGGPLWLSVGVGYQVAVSPAYRATPLTPAYDHAWLFSSRMSF